MVTPSPASAEVRLPLSMQPGERAVSLQESQGMNIYLPYCHNASPLNMYFFFGRQYPTVLWESCHFKTIFSLLSPFLMILQMWHFFFPLENLFHINMFISVNLFNWRASPLQLVSSASINHSLAQYSPRLILNNSVYKICFKTHLSLGIYVHIRNTQ